jgi:hypothetical protein
MPISVRPAGRSEATLAPGSPYHGSQTGQGFVAGREQGRPRLPGCPIVREEREAGRRRGCGHVGNAQRCPRRGGQRGQHGVLSHAPRGAGVVHGAGMSTSQGPPRRPGTGAGRSWPWPRTLQRPALSPGATSPSRYRRGEPPSNTVQHRMICHQMSLPVVSTRGMPSATAPASSTQSGTTCGAGKYGLA